MTTRQEQAQPQKVVLYYELRAIDHALGRIGRNPLAESEVVSAYLGLEDAEDARTRPRVLKNAIKHGRVKSPRGLDCELVVCERPIAGLLAQLPDDLADDFRHGLEESTGAEVDSERADLVRRVGESEWTELKPA